MVGNTTPTSVSKILIFSPFVAYPSIDFIYRIANGIIAPEISSEFSLNPAELGLVSSIFFMAFGLAQLPLGVALDRFGPRNLTACLLGISIVGTLIFINANCFTELILGRFLLGFGMAASLIAGIKTATLWLKGQLSIATSILICATGIGGMIATVPFSGLLEQVSWRLPFLGLAFATGLLLITILILVPAANPIQKYSIVNEFSVFGRIFRSSTLWKYAPITMACVGVGSAYQTLWAPLWLRDVAGFRPDKIGWVMFAMLGAYASGNLVFGWITQRFAELGKPTMHFAVTAVILFIFCQIFIAAQVKALAVPLWTAASFLLAGAYATYPIVTSKFPTEYAARTSSALNFLVFSSAFFSQWLAGLVVNAFPISSNGQYSPDGYSYTIIIGTLLQIFGLSWYFYVNRRNNVI